MNRAKSAYSVKTGIYDFKIDDVDKSKRIVRLIGNTYNFLDSQLDVMQDGACKKSIEMAGPKSKDGPKVKFCLDHDLTTRPGKIIELCEKKMTIKGESMMCLYAETELVDTPEGNATLTNYLSGIIDQHSIGYNEDKVERFSPLSEDIHEQERWEEFSKTFTNPQDYEELQKKCWYSDVHALHEIRLLEISAVGFGANSLTPYLGNKSMNPETFDIALDTMEMKLLILIDSLAGLEGSAKTEAKFTMKLHIKQMKAMRNEIYGRESIKKYLAEEFNRPLKEITNNSAINIALEEAAKNIMLKNNLK